MLANSGPSTPRPKPPAKARRASTRQKSSPPPPYVLKPDDQQRPMLETLLGSPVMATSQILDFFGKEGSEQSAEDWLHERSRDELRELLVRAEQTIKEREDG
jgi:hypothetical protein